MPNKKLAKDYDVVVETMKKVKTEIQSSIDNFSSETEDGELSSEDEESAVVVDKNASKKQRKKKTKKNQKNQNESKKSNFTPFDYAKANYDKFVTAGPKNLKKLLSSKISFGSNKKVCLRNRILKFRTRWTN